MKILNVISSVTITDHNYAQTQISCLPNPKDMHIMDVVNRIIALTTA